MRAGELADEYIQTSTQAAANDGISHARRQEIRTGRTHLTGKLGQPDKRYSIN